jgi:hypothetical protein
MIDSTPKFDPIPRLQQIAATIRERGAYTFDAPATAAYYIECAIKEIERLRKERDELRCEVCDWVGNHFKEPPQDVAKRNGWNCFDTGVWDCYKEETK